MYQGATSGIAQQNAINEANARNAALWGSGINAATKAIGNSNNPFNFGGWGSGLGTGGVAMNTPSFDQYYNMSSQYTG
jgi:hypothetical protein